MSPEPPMLPFFCEDAMPGLRGKEVISFDEEMTECLRTPEAALPGGTMRPARGTLYNGPEVGICKTNTV